MSWKASLGSPHRSSFPLWLNRFVDYPQRRCRAPGGSKKKKNNFPLLFFKYQTLSAEIWHAVVYLCIFFLFLFKIWKPSSQSPVQIARMQNKVVNNYPISEDRINDLLCSTLSYRRVTVCVYNKWEMFNRNIGPLEIVCSSFCLFFFFSF